MTVNVPSRGEFFVRDSGGPGPVVLLLHGWMVTADVNWIHTYAAVIAGGYRVIALDHRGHGRGLRPTAPFRLTDCAEDAAAVIDELDAGPVLAVGYSMGGPIAQLLARSRPDLVGGLVLCATTPEWTGPDFDRLWRIMGLVRIVVSVAPFGFWTTMMRLNGLADDETASWLIGELGRCSPATLAEAGRELGRFDSRPWLADLRMPAAVVVTTADTSVPPARQRAMADQLGAASFDVAGDHLVARLPDGRFDAGLLAALAHVGRPPPRG
ncbi:MAG TPA: alpha/beta hydrolase [Solirubrobacteraceae bacterium]|jgi:3-oxoadipate enol-lactonase|nr:alpha/beta hydrolase [Solirubrobacteraceae bacterium]